MNNNTDTIFNVFGGITLIRIEQPNQNTNQILEEIEKQLYLWDNTFSLFKPESELSIFNKQNEGIYNTSDLLKSFIVASQKALEISEGYVDVSCGFKTKNNLNQIKIIKNQIVKNEPVCLDPGGLLKGMMCDHIKTILEKHQINNCIVSCSRDVLIGDNTATIDILSENDQIIGQIQGNNIAVATSSSNEPLVKTPGKTENGIINPITNKKTQTKIKQVSAIAPNCYLAEILAKQCLILENPKKLIYGGIIEDKNNNIFIQKSNISIINA